MISEQEKNDLLKKILESQEFKDSKRFAELLQFLVSHTVPGESLKETTIAIDFFGREANFDPGKDSFVRSYISNLRKKLEHYYLMHPDFEYRITIPKGHYNIEFISRGERISEKPSFKIKKAYIIYAAVGILALLASVLFVLNATKPFVGSNEMRNNPLLSNLAGTPKNKTIIALGDYFFFSDNKKEPAERNYIRNSDINNEKDFTDWVNSDPSRKGKYEILNFTYLRPSTTLGLFNIINKFNMSPENFEVKMASALRWQDLENSNIIFIGSIKTFHILDTIILKTNFKYDLKARTISILNAKKDTSSTLHIQRFRSGEYSEDCSVILKIPASSNRSILVLSGFGEVGIMGSLKIAIEDDFCGLVNTAFHKKIDSPEQYYSVISMVKGVQHSVLEYKMVSFEWMKFLK